MSANMNQCLCQPVGATDDANKTHGVFSWEKKKKTRLNQQHLTV